MGSFAWQFGRFGWALGDFEAIAGWRRLAGRLWWCTHVTSTRPWWQRWRFHRLV